MIEFLTTILDFIFAIIIALSGGVIGYNWGWRNSHKWHMEQLENDYD